MNYPALPERCMVLWVTLSIEHLCPKAFQAPRTEKELSQRPEKVTLNRILTDKGRAGDSLLVGSESKLLCVVLMRCQMWPRKGTQERYRRVSLIHSHTLDVGGMAHCTGAGKGCHVELG